MSQNEILVRDWMTASPLVVSPTTGMMEAYELMMEASIRRLPVLQGERLVGIVTLGDLREARPSPATSLSIYEMNYLLARLTVAQIMTHQPYTVTPETPVQVAARIMLERKVGGLPVLNREGTLAGIITESDIFRMLIERWEDAIRPQERVALAATG